MTETHEQRVERLARDARYWFAGCKSSDLRSLIECLIASDREAGLVTVPQDAIAPFLAMGQVLDCRDMHERHPTTVGVHVPHKGPPDYDEMELEGDVSDEQWVFSASATAYGATSTFGTSLLMGDFRRLQSAIAAHEQEEMARLS